MYVHEEGIEKETRFEIATDKHDFKIQQILTQTRYLSSYGWLILICSSKSYEILINQKRACP